MFGTPNDTCLSQHSDSEHHLHTIMLNGRLRVERGVWDDDDDDGREEEDHLIDDTLSSYLPLTIMLMERLRVERGVEGRDDETKTKTKFWTTIYVCVSAHKMSCSPARFPCSISDYVSIMRCSSVLSIRFICRLMVLCFLSMCE